MGTRWSALMDGSIFATINGLAGHVDLIDDGFELLARFGPLALVALLLGVWFWPGVREERDRRQWAAIVATVGATAALGLNQVIVRLWSRPRPFVAHHAHLLLAPSRDPAFPSDHATFGFAIAVALVLVLRRIGILALCCAALVGLARVYTGEHYLSDVVGGALIGGLITLAVFGIQPLLRPVLDPPLRLARRVHLA